MSKIISERKIWGIIITIIVIFSVTFQSLLFLGYGFKDSIWGFENDDGIKTAGYFIRTNTEPYEMFESDVDGYKTRYYFNREYFTHIYNNFNGDYVIRNARTINNDNLSYIVLKNNSKFLKDVNELSLCAVVVNEAEEPLVYIYSVRRECENTSIMKTSVYNSEFDKKFGNLENITSLFL